ncbi:hypothetical protein V2J09_016373 [Rumex salicifolius]
MTGEFARTSISQSDSDIGKLLASLQPSEISEAFTGVFCPDCQSALKTRLLNFIQQRKDSISGTVVVQSSIEAKASTTSSSTSPLQSTSTSGRGSWGHPLRKNSDSATSSPASVIRSSNQIVGDETELARVKQVARKKNLVYYENVGGRKVNVLQGLELHTGVFNTQEQADIVKSVYNLQEMGRNGRLRDRTYSEPKKWMRGKGRVTLQFGCCYNYAVDKDGNPPGIIRDEEVDPLPSVFKDMIKRLVRWQILPPTCVPNSCIVNIYDEGDCIPPHIDHHDFVRPFCTVSFLTEANILFGSNLKIVGPGDFSGPFSLPLPLGSVLILSGNGADIAKHCVPGVPGKRISVTFRKMDDGKLPFKFRPDPDLLNVRPLTRPLLLPNSQSAIRHPIQSLSSNGNGSGNKDGKGSSSFFMTKDDFPPLGS